MSKVTSKYQISIPKAVADRLGVRPGDDLEWGVAGDELRVTLPRRRTVMPIEKRLKMFDAATSRQEKRDRGRRLKAQATRGWTREDLYDRGRTR